MLKLSLESLEDLAISDSYAISVSEDYCGQLIQQRVRVRKDQALAFITNYLQNQDLDLAKKASTQTQQTECREEVRPETAANGQ